MVFVRSLHFDPLRREGENKTNSAARACKNHLVHGMIRLGSLHRIVTKSWSSQGSSKQGSVRALRWVDLAVLILLNVLLNFKALFLSKWLVIYHLVFLTVLDSSLKLSFTSKLEHFKNLLTTLKKALNNHFKLTRLAFASPLTHW